MSELKNTEVIDLVIKKSEDTFTTFWKFKINHFEIILEDLLKNQLINENSENDAFPEFERLPIVMEYSFDQLKLCFIWRDDSLDVFFKNKFNIYKESYLNKNSNNAFLWKDTFVMDKLVTYKCFPKNLIKDLKKNILEKWMIKINQTNDYLSIQFILNDENNQNIQPSEIEIIEDKEESKYLSSESNMSNSKSNQSFRGEIENSLKVHKFDISKLIDEKQKSFKGNMNKKSIAYPLYQNLLILKDFIMDKDCPLWDKLSLFVKVIPFIQIDDENNEDAKKETAFPDIEIEHEVYVIGYDWSKEEFDEGIRLWEDVLKDIDQLFNADLEYSITYTFPSSTAFYYWFIWLRKHCPLKLNYFSTLEPIEANFNVFLFHERADDRVDDEDFVLNFKGHNTKVKNFFQKTFENDEFQLEKIKVIEKLPTQDWREKIKEIFRKPNYSKVSKVVYVNSESTLKFFECLVNMKVERTIEYIKNNKNLSHGLVSDIGWLFSDIFHEKISSQGGSLHYTNMLLMSNNSHYKEHHIELAPGWTNYLLKMLRVNTAKINNGAYQNETIVDLIIKSLNRFKDCMWTFENLLKDMTYYSYRQSLKGSQNLKNESIDSALGTIDQDLAKIVEKSAGVFTDLFIQCIERGIFILNGEKGIVSIDDVEENKESQSITGNRNNDHDITINQARRKWHLGYKDPIELLLKQSNAKLKLYMSIKSYFKDSVMLFDSSEFSDILRLPELAQMLNEYEFTQRGKYATVTHWKVAEILGYLKYPKWRRVNLSRKLFDFASRKPILLKNVLRKIDEGSQEYVELVKDRDTPIFQFPKNELHSSFDPLLDGKNIFDKF
jgi:hypothetical protein